ncbi:alpha-L-fucosidase [Arenibacter certesii]|uniref:Glycoside hydrolase family 29 N-terminal domain-containing protein n=1 Tax=Arenibacter certesii TaxID=228955 RepID=A0A918IZ07_9FLAO|nr:alpha-L-fucosidase [Arenibacter certesii]GGW39532.1 hypothetical protein GCM10007383_25360 [Arenibacter certesii]
MKKRYWTLVVVLIVLSSCKTTEKDAITFVGELFAKNVIGLQGNILKQIEKPEYSWYISTSQSGEWKELPGIWTNEIVLLTSYVGNFIKCEITYIEPKSDKRIGVSVISSQAVEYKGNPNTDWFKDAGFGIMVHYLKEAIIPEGGAEEWNRTVDSFNVDRFARQVNEAGAGYVMFTLGQNSGYYCSPNKAFDRALGIGPGELCSKRDLPKDLINALNKYKIPLILYLPSNPPINNKNVSEKLRYAFQKDSATSQFNQPILENMIEEWSLRYGEGVKGWWFDGLYSWNDIRSTRMDMSLKHNISTHSLAAKSGNKKSIVTYNSGFGKIHGNTPYDDYTSGEKSTIDEYPLSRWAEDGVQWFLFTYLGEKWGGHGQQFITDSLVNKAVNIVNNKGVLCLEVVTNAKGEILPGHFDQIKAVGSNLRELR